MNLEDLPLMTRTEAYKKRVQYFRVKKGCKECGCEIFYRPRVNQIMTLCYECYPDVEVPTLCKINAAERHHNEKVRKTSNQRYCIPRVFGGMNTK